MTGLVFSLAFNLTATPIAAQAEESDSSLRLSGGVSHSDRLDPLPEEDRVGAVISPQSIAPPAAPAHPPAAKERPPARQVIPPTFTPAAAQRSQNRVQWPLPVPPRQNPQQGWTQQNWAQHNQHQFQSITPQSIPSQSGQSSHSGQLRPPSRADQLAVAEKAREQAAEALHQSQAAQSQQAAINMLRGLNAHVNTAGSPQAPRFQVLPTAQQADPRLSGRAAAMDPAATYQHNLQALASLDLSHSAGNQALQAHIQAGGQTVKVEVPFWLAGEWVRSETNETSRTELPSGKSLKAVGKQTASVTDVFGITKDKDGKVWMVVPLHNKGQVDRGFAIDRSQVNKYELVLTGKTSALVKVQASHTIVDKKTKKVIQAFQDEEFNAYSLVSDGLVKTDSSVKVFDQMGNPKLLTHAVSMEKRVRKF